MENNSRKLIALLKARGWIEVSQTGSHVTLKHADNPLLCTVPHPKKDLPIGLTRQIYKITGLR